MHEPMHTLFAYFKRAKVKYELYVANINEFFFPKMRTWIENNCYYIIVIDIISVKMRVFKKTYLFHQYLVNFQRPFWQKSALAL